MKFCRAVAGVLFVLGWMPMAAWSQTAPPSAAPPAAVPASFAIHGVVRSGATKLPGVSITASHSLTGRKVITSTNVDGSFHLELPGKGRWVLRAEFSAFTSQTAEVVLTPAEPDVAHDFELVLLSRAPKAAPAEGETEIAESTAQTRVAHSPTGARGAQRLTVNADDAALAQSSLSGDQDASAASGLAASVDATNQSVSVSGRMGNAQDLGVQNMDDLRDRIDELRARGQWNGGGSDFGGGPGGGGFTMGGPGGGGGPGAGGGGGGRMRMGSLSRPHGQIYYTGSNAALDAAPYSLSGPAEKPSYGSNKIGASIGGVLKIPHIYDDGGKTFVFLNYSGIRSSNPYDVFSHVPTEAERGGDLSGTLVNGNPVQLFDPTNPGSPLDPSHVAVSEAAASLLQYFPLPNVFNDPLKNFHFSSAAASDQDIFALRVTHNFGAAIAQRGAGGGGRGGGGRPRNNLSFGLNYQRNQSDNLEPFPTVGGHTHTNGFNANVGWAVSKGKLSNQLRFTWNRSRSHANNYYANTTDVVSQAGITGVSDDPLNWGVPGLVFSDFSSLTDIAPSERDSQTFTLSESFGWVRGKHHLHFGTDYRWIDNKAYASSNPRGTFTFTGSSTSNFVGGAAVPGTGYDFADFLLGYAQSTTLGYSAVHDQYFAHSYDFFVQDDWRARANLTLNLGLRYEFISPYREANNYLANLDAGFSGTQFLGAVAVQPNTSGPNTPGFYQGHYGSGLMNPDRNNFAPRIGIAWKPFGNKTVVRAGYGINYNLGQYSSIVQSLAAQPPFAVTQTNAAPATGPSTFTLANGFPASAAIRNNYGIDPNYRTAYVQLWNLNIQREITSTLLLNVGYTGSKGTALDMLRAPNRGPDGTLISTVEPFNWETSQGSSILHAGSVRLRKRMTRGVSVGGTYTYSKSIDNASSIGGGAQVVAQDDTNLRAERGLSSFDQRHKLSGDWLVELPWGEGRKWLTRPGFVQTVLGDWLLQSTFTVASGTPYTARVLGNYSNVSGGTNGTLRADYDGAPIQIGDRNIKHWFDTAAFTTPAAGTYGNSGRNTIIGPGSWLMSLVLSKNIPLKDSMSLEMRAEADNVLNHANYSGIDTTVNSPTYGQVTSVASMRKMVLSVHYRF